MLSGKEAAYIIEEDDRYHIGILNMNARSIILTMNINVSAKVYDTTKAKNMCSTVNGSCRLRLFFPITNYVILTAPENVRLTNFLSSCLYSLLILSESIFPTKVTLRNFCQNHLFSNSGNLPSFQAFTIFFLELFL